MITIEEARESIGELVAYTPEGSPASREQGVITSVNDKYVFVQYSWAANGIATVPNHLQFLRRQDHKHCLLEGCQNKKLIKKGKHENEILRGLR